MIASVKNISFKRLNVKDNKKSWSKDSTAIPVPPSLKRLETEPAPSPSARVRSVNIKTIEAEISRKSFRIVISLSIRIIYYEIIRYLIRTWYSSTLKMIKSTTYKKYNMM